MKVPEAFSRILPQQNLQKPGFPSALPQPQGLIPILTSRNTTGRRPYGPVVQSKDPIRLVIPENGFVHPTVVVDSLTRFHVDARVKITRLFERFYRFQTEEVSNLNQNMKRSIDSILSGLGIAAVKGAMFSEGFYAMPYFPLTPCARSSNFQVYMIRRGFKADAPRRVERVYLDRNPLHL